ncbi:MAG: hypothetical protein ACRD9Y_06945, partial [Blastocatellia bacterium]
MLLSPKTTTNSFSINSSFLLLINGRARQWPAEFTAEPDKRRAHSHYEILEINPPRDTPLARFLFMVNLYVD